MSKNLVIFIPGTFDKEHEWAKSDGLIPEKLRQSDLFYDAEFKIHEWDYGNSHSSRQEAGRRLADKVEALDAKMHFQRLIIIGHSHGGNVALYAARYLDKKDISTEIVCLGTPYFPARFWNSLLFELPVSLASRFIISLTIGFMLVILYYSNIFEAMPALDQFFMSFYVEIREPLVRMVTYGIEVEPSLFIEFKQVSPSFQAVKTIPAVVAIIILLILISPLFSLQYFISKFIVEIFAYGAEPSSEWIERVKFMYKPRFVVKYKMRMFRNLVRSSFSTLIVWFIMTLGLMFILVNIIHVVLVALYDAGIISDMMGDSEYLLTISSHGYAYTVFQLWSSVTSGWFSWLVYPSLFLVVILGVLIPSTFIGKPLSWLYFSSWFIYLPVYNKLLQHARQWRKDLHIPPLHNMHLLSIAYRKDEAALLLRILNKVSRGPRMVATAIYSFLRKLWNRGGKYFVSLVFLILVLQKIGVLTKAESFSQVALGTILFVTVLFMVLFTVLSFVSIITVFARTHPYGFGWERPSLHLFLDLKPSSSAKHIKCASLHQVIINPKGKWSVFYKHGDIKQNFKVAILIEDWLREERGMKDRVTLL